MVRSKERIRGAWRYFNALLLEFLHKGAQSREIIP
jgi:hypothetical protein